MKPTPVQVSQLHSFLQVLHGAKLRQFQQMANTFTQFLQGLPRFNIVDTTPQQPHVGRVIVDGVLQQGKDYEKVVRHAVECVTKFGEAATLSGFTALLSKEPLKNVLGNFSKENTKRDLLNTTDFFIHKQLDTFDDITSVDEARGQQRHLCKGWEIRSIF